MNLLDQIRTLIHLQYFIQIQIQYCLKIKLIFKQYTDTEEADKIVINKFDLLYNNLDNINYIINNVSKDNLNNMVKLLKDTVK